MPKTIGSHYIFDQANATAAQGKDALPSLVYVDAKSNDIVVATHVYTAPRNEDFVGDDTERLKTLFSTQTLELVAEVPPSRDNTFTNLVNNIAPNLVKQKRNTL